MPWSPSWPARLPDPFPPDPPTPPKYEPLPGTKPFWAIYRRVTAKLREYELRHGGEVKEFMEFLIGGFYAEYQEWDKRAEYEDYLGFFRSAPFRSFRLIGHAYFHMAYDLPRTIAASLESTPQLSILSADRAEARMTFYDLNDTFIATFVENSRSYECNGVFGLMAKVLRLTSVAETAAFWVLHLRGIAWANGENIAAARDKAKKEEYEKAILAQVVKAGRDVAKHKWNPIIWLTKLRGPSLRVLVGVPLSGLVTPGRIRIVVWVALLLWVLLQSAYFALYLAINELGRNMTHRLEEIMSPEQRLRLYELRREIASRRRDEEDLGRPRFT